MKSQIKNVLLTVWILILVLTPQSASYAQVEAANLGEYQDVEKALYDYFDTKYRLFLDGSSIDELSLFESIESGKRFPEVSKLHVELEHADLYDLRYKSYTFWLNIESVDNSNNGDEVNVILKESHEVIFNATAPVVSKMWDLIHNITLRQRDQRWIVTYDNYEDYLWKVLAQSNLSITDFREMMISANQERDEIGNSHNFSLIFEQKLMGSYYAAGAVNYAHDWANSRNPEFYDFGNVDCTNFVSQALNKGVYIPMTAAQGGVGTSGWYYANVNNRAAAWTWAPSLYSYIINQENPNYFPGKGPKGYRVYGLSSVAEGDLIFYNIVDQPQVQDHAVIVVVWSVSQPLVAGHSPNVDYYPYDAFNYSQTFLVHITGY